MFFVVGSGLGQSLLSALLLTLAILLSVAVTFFSSRLLSRTALRGESSSFVLPTADRKPVGSSSAPSSTAPSLSLDGQSQWQLLRVL